MKDEEIFTTIDNNIKVIKMADGSAHLNVVDAVYAVKDLIKQSQLDLLGRLEEQTKGYLESNSTKVEEALPIAVITHERERIEKGE